MRQFWKTWRRLGSLVLLLGVILGNWGVPAGVNECQACPMCKAATEASGDLRQPRAYMASILTMLGMPAVLFTVLGVSMYRIALRESAVVEELDRDAPAANRDQSC